MSKIETNDKSLYYKRMTLVSASLTVEVKEKADYSYTNSDGKKIKQIEHAYVRIFHSPSKFINKDVIELNTREELKDYIKMLQDFDSKYGHYLEEVQKKGGKK
jgi:hypothetical protein